MSKVNLDWANIGFNYHKTDKRYVAHYKDGKWDKGELVDDAVLHLSECAEVFQYCQQCFEGLKARRTKNGDIAVFRPDMNAKRMHDAAVRLEMPPFPEDQFIDAVKQVIKANLDWLPPYGTGASLYLRPFMIGTDPIIGVSSANVFEFRIFCTPVGPYYKGGAKPISLLVSDFDRSAPHGTGNIKAGLNYAMSLYDHTLCKAQGFDENMYLDPATRTYVDETGGSNFIFITKDNEVVTPLSDSILPSITRRSCMYVAEHYLGLKTTQRKVRFDELKDFAECGVCGTAAVISPVGRVVNHGEELIFPSGMEHPGPITEKLLNTLSGIQECEIEAPEGWILKVEE